MLQTRNISLLLQLAAVLLLPLMLRADEKAAQDGAELLRHWETQSHLFNKNFAPVQLKATFKLLGLKSGTASGTLDAVFLTPEKWRTELILPSYQEVLLRNGEDKVWRKRSLPMEPLRVTQLKQLLGLPKVVEIASAPENIERVRERKYEGQKLTCVRYSTGSKEYHSKSREELCFDSERRVVFRDRDPGHERYEYSGYREFKRAQVPTIFRLLVDGNEAVQARIVDLGERVDNALALLTPDASFEARTWCEQAIPPKPQYTPDPEYTAVARRERLEATVTVMGEVRTDGTFDNVAVVQSGNQSLHESTLRAVSQWRFQPATCKGSPIPFELRVEVNYHLR